MFKKLLLMVITFFGIASAHAQTTTPDRFGFVDKALGDFTFENAQPDWYQGTFTYNDVTYDPSTGVAFDLSQLDDGFSYFPSGPDGDGKVVYLFYKQQHSAVVGNIVKGDADRSFVKAVAGELSPATALPAEGGSYTYTGKVFNHIPGTEGTITYTIATNGANWNGSGSVEGITGKRPPVVGDVAEEFTISGMLNEEAITVVGDKVAPVTGTADLTLTLVGTDDTEALKDVQYDLGVYGPNAEEIAGRIYGGDLQEKVSGYGFGASRE